MYFKRLEIVGFKSFSEKTTIEFPAGVTAIVGPNGCGKSNVSDAIRWALGEQSAKSLRGSSMEDVIFNGSSTKEPLNLAEVSLTLSNESRILAIDYDEVTITRRLYRSGESEYLINKNTVRLRDVHEILMGTGIGTESYAVIEQGKMDRVLNAKPDERRAIFEEAAGITKFKSKKKEALRKLEQTDQNLLRVNDIIQEVKRQIGSIERQAKKAENYKREFERLKALELKVSLKEFVAFGAHRSEGLHQIEALKTEEAEAAAVLKEIEARHGEYAGRLSELDRFLQESQAKELETGGQIRHHQDRILLNRERVGELCERREGLTAQIELSGKRSQELAAESLRLDEEYGKLVEDERKGLEFLGTVEARFAAIETAVSEAIAGIETDKVRLFDVANERARVNTELAKVRAELSVFKARYAKIDERRQSLSSQSAALETELGSFLGDLEIQEARLLRKRTELQEKEALLAALDDKVRAGKDALNGLWVEESTLRSKLEFLNDLKNRQEGLSGGARALLEAKSGGAPESAGMVGLLADLIKVEPGYELAVEAALESYAEALVFDGDEAVLRAAEFLRPLKRGRALLLSLAFGRDHQKAEAHFQGASPILRAITPDPAIEGLLQALLGNVYVVENPSDAFHLSRTFAGIVCVTQSGERFESRVVMGGSLSSEADATLVGREARLRDLEGRIEAVSASIATAETTLAADEAEEERLRGQIKADGEELHLVQSEQADAKGRVRHLELRKKNFEEELAVSTLELSALAADEAKFFEAETTLSVNADALASQAADIERGLAEAEQRIRDRQKEKEDLLVELTETRSHQSHRTAQREKVEKDRGWVLESAANEAARIQEFEDEIAMIGQKKQALEEESTGLENETAALSLVRDEILRKMEGGRLERESVAAQIESVQAERHDRESFLQSVRDKVHSLDLEQAKLQYEIDRLKERIYNAYQIDLEVQASIRQTEADAEAAFAGQEAAEEVIDLDAAHQEIQAQRERLNKLGPVNLAAMQEYDEMKERFDFLTKQEQDLVQAKEDLQKAIQKINRTTREMFKDTFEKIKEYFSEYYRELFGGGQAELVLLDAEDVLESGIEIVARPPGKKLQSISLLSGGEKALTATALLFAIFKVKPSPFCILDEIDAPLDESNVDRFCRVLREFITGSQFILITHNKRTMNLADAMYGVTMAETGSSKVVSVRFADKRPQVSETKENKELEAVS